MVNKQTIKRVVDVTASLVGIAVTFPVMVAIAVAEVAEHRNRDIIFRQNRLGKDGKPFRVLKFKTIKQVRDSNQKLLDEDSPKRKTPFLRQLRKTGLDELPQLFNILKGDMSLVGPRPYPTSLISPGDYKRSILIKERQAVRPGLFNSNHTIPNARENVKWPERLENDVIYARNHNLVSDFQIIVKSLITIARYGHHEVGVPMAFKKFHENSWEILELEKKISTPDISGTSSQRKNAPHP